MNHSVRLSEATELSNQIKALAASKCRLFHENASTAQFWCTLQQLTARTYLLRKISSWTRFFPPAFYLHFARTRRRHPMEVGAACAAAGAAGLHLAGEAMNISSRIFVVLRVGHHKLLKRRNHKCMAALRLQPSELF